MANNYKQLAALRPADTAEAQLYQPGSGRQVIGVLNICNQDSSARTFRVALTKLAGSAGNEEWLCFDESLAAVTSKQIKGLTLSNPNTIRVTAGIADKLSFVFYGVEIS